MSDLAQSPTLRLPADGRPAWIVRGRPTLFRLAAVVVEAVLVTLVGTTIESAAAAAGQDITVLSPGLVGAAYLAAVLASNALPAAPRFEPQARPFMALGLIFLIALVLGVGIGHSTAALAVWFVVSAMAVATVRRSTQLAAFALGGAILLPASAAFIGNSEIAALMLREIQSQERPHQLQIGYFDDRQGRPGPLTGLLPCLGTVDDVVSYIQDQPLDVAYVAMPWSAGKRIDSVISRLRFLPLTVLLLPDHLPPVLSGRQKEDFHGIILPTLMLPPMSAFGRVFKRGIDLALSSLLLLALAPVFLGLAVLIRLDSPGPVFFTQPRSGRYGRPFRIFKFRSLDVARLDTAAETLVAKGDPRVTRVGKFIRKYSLDEIPQIVNVFLGDMSLVGPRPHAARAKADGRIYAEVVEDYMLRYRVKPGMTGWAQVNGWRGNTDTAEKLSKRVEYDFIYIETWSVLLDLKILLMTFRSVVAPPADNA